MRHRLVVVEPRKTQIQPSPGFAKKGLATYHLELAALCGFKCKFCSSNFGNYSRTHHQEWSKSVSDQLPGEQLNMRDSRTRSGDAIMLGYRNIIGLLEAELADVPPDFGAGETLQFGELVDNYSPLLVADETTRKALDILLARTKFRIRILTKSAEVGKPEWVEYFRQHRDRIIVGLSITTLDESIVETTEEGTSKPSARIRAHRALQDAGVPVYAMLCPVLPESVQYVDELLDQLRPEMCETVWAEPVNDRSDLWSATHPMTDQQWSRYATDLYRAIALRADDGKWISKLNFLLYEGGITMEDSAQFLMGGYSLQSTPDADGRSTHVYFMGLPSGQVITSQYVEWSNPGFSAVASVDRMMTGYEFIALCSSIRRHGLLDPIVIDRRTGEIVDGRNRFRACCVTGVEPKYIYIDSRDDDDLLEYVAARVTRKHLSDSERAYVAAHYCRYTKRGARGAGSNGPNGPFGYWTASRASAAFNVSMMTLKRAKAVLAAATPELWDAVRSRQLDVATAHNLIESLRERPDARREAARMLVDGASLNAIKTLLAGRQPPVPVETDELAAGLVASGALASSDEPVAVLAASDEPAVELASSDQSTVSLAASVRSAVEIAAGDALGSSDEPAAVLGTSDEPAEQPGWTMWGTPPMEADSHSMRLKQRYDQVLSKRIALLLDCNVDLREGYEERIAEMSRSAIHLPARLRDRLERLANEAGTTVEVLVVEELELALNAVSVVRAE